MYSEIDFNSYIDVTDLKKPALSRRQEFLLLCFYAGRIDASAWKQYLLVDPVLAAYCRRPPGTEAVH